MFASVKEERTVIGGVELARKTVVAATDQGLVYDLHNTVEAPVTGHPRDAKKCPNGRSWPPICTGMCKYTRVFL